MIIGVPKEIKKAENRVALTPAGVHRFVSQGHEVLVQSRAGEGSGFSDKEYQDQGAFILPTGREVFKEAQMIMKVKEPQLEEIPFLREEQVLYTYLHLAADKDLTLGLQSRGVVAVAYETIEVNGKLVLLEPMSEVAGKIASIMGAYYLARPYGGRGILAGGVAGVHSANFLIIGGGTAGLNAAKVAAGLGARVVIMDVNLERMRYLEDVLPKNCETIMSDKVNLEKEAAQADVIIGAVLIPGGRTPRLITKAMLALMKPHTVLIDISVDQGGIAESSRPTSHEDPVYLDHGVLHYCVSNMPGAYPRSSTFALTNATLPYGLEIANKGWIKAALENQAITRGINLVKGDICYEKVAEAHDLPYTELSKLIG